MEPAAIRKPLGICQRRKTKLHSTSAMRCNCDASSRVGATITARSFPVGSCLRHEPAEALSTYFQSEQNGNSVCSGFAGARRSTTEHISTLHQNRNGLHLDCGRINQVHLLNISSQVFRAFISAHMRAETMKIYTERQVHQN